MLGYFQPKWMFDMDADELLLNLTGISFDVQYNTNYKTAVSDMKLIIFPVTEKMP